jgi:nucleoside-diphosphate-sugar epimerase
MKSEYAMTKLVGEQVLRLVGYFEAVTILRFGIVYGPRLANWSAVEALFNAVRSEEFVAVGSLATGRRFVHVDDIVFGILTSLGRAGYEIFNLSGDQILTLENVIQESARLLGRNPKVEEKNQHSVSIRNPDNSKAKSELGWQPRIGLNSGLATLL